MSCEGACAHAHVRCAVTRVRVRAKSILESVRDVRACGPFMGVRCAIALLHLFAHFFGTKLPVILCFRTFFPTLEHPFLFWIILFYFRTSFFCFGTHQTIKMMKNCWKKFEKLMEIDWKIAEVRVRVQIATTSDWVCAHVCVRTLIWMCEVRACDPKNRRNSHLENTYGLFCVLASEALQKPARRDWSVDGTVRLLHMYFGLGSMY